MAAHTILIDIDPDDCADLLGCAPIGRLGVVVHGHPEIFPVNHVYDRESGCVVFPTERGPSSTRHSTSRRSPSRSTAYRPKVTGARACSSSGRPRRSLTLT